MRTEDLRLTVDELCEALVLADASDEELLARLTGGFSGLQESVGPAHPAAAPLSRLVALFEDLAGKTSEGILAVLRQAGPLAASLQQAVADAPEPAPVPTAAAAFLNLERIGRLSHDMESLLEKARDGHVAFDDTMST